VASAVPFAPHYLTINVTEIKKNKIFETKL